MQRENWSDRTSSAILSACLHVAALIVMILATPLMHVAPQTEAHHELVVPVQLTPPPKPPPPRVTEPVRQPPPEPAPQPRPVEPRPAPPTPSPEPSPTPKPAPTPEPQPRPIETPRPVITPRPLPAQKLATPRLTPAPLIAQPRPSPVPAPTPVPAPAPAPEKVIVQPVNAPPKIIPRPDVRATAHRDQPQPDTLRSAVQPQFAPRPDEAIADREEERELERQREALHAAEAARQAAQPAPAASAPAASASSASAAAASAPSTPRGAPPAAASPGAPPVSFRVSPAYGRVEDEASGGLRGVLRATVGCDHADYAHLSLAEREKCQRAMVRDASHGPSVDPVPAAKREDYDREAAANARKRGLKEGPLPTMIVPCSGPGANLGGGCLPDEAHIKVQPK